MRGILPERASVGGEKKEVSCHRAIRSIGCISGVPCSHLAASHRAKDAQLLLSVLVHLSFFLLVCTSLLLGRES